METPKTDLELKKPHIPFTERLKSIPEVFGIRINEEPHYEVLKKESDYEVRHYPAQVVAKITVRGLSFNDFREIGFNNLASYIFGENLDEKDMPMTAPVLEKKEIAMTAPVLQQQDKFGSWTMSFILPHEYTIHNAPRPKDPRIVLEEIPAYDAASVSYSGNNTFEKIEFQKKELKKWLEKHPEYHAVGDFFIADYSAPFVIPFMKKNEVHVKLQAVHVH